MVRANKYISTKLSPKFLIPRTRACIISFQLALPSSLLGGRLVYKSRIKSQVKNEAKFRSKLPESINLKINFFGNLQVDKRFSLTHTIYFSKFFGHKLEQVFMVFAKNFEHDVVSAADENNINHFIKF
jgi:hypothetical protein